MIGDLPATPVQNEKGKTVLPDEPFKTSGEVKEYCSSLISADKKRSGWRADIEGVLTGLNPIDPAALKAKKMSWYPNANYREMEGYIQAPQTAFYDLVTEADPCIDITLDYGKGQERADWEDVIENAFTWLMFQKWRLGFNFHVPLCQREMLVHGLGSHVWPRMNTNQWIERTPKTGHILFPDDCPVNFEEEGESFMLRDFVSLRDLHGFIQNEEAARKLGWNPDIVWKVLAMVSKSSNTSASDMEAHIRRIKQGDTDTRFSRQSGVWLNWVFAREIGSQKVSLYVVAETIDPGDFLFRKRNLYEQWPIAMFPYDIGNGTIHSIRGLGARVKDFFQLSNRIKNTMAAQVILGSTVLLQQTGTIDPAKMKLLKMGMMSILPQNMQVAQGFRFPDLSQGPLALDQNLHDTLRNNTQAYANGSPEAKDRETALSYQMRAQDSSQVSKGAHGLYGSHLCNYWNIKLRMVLEAAKMEGNKPYITMAKAFVDRCKRRGVPEEAFDHIVEVKEVMATGAGSAAARIQAFLSLFESPVYANTSEDRRVNAERDFAAALFAGSKVDRYARSLDDGDMTDDDDSMIALENAAMNRGEAAVVAPRQNQSKHAQGHLQAAGALVEASQQGANPEEVLMALQQYGPHIAEHLQRLQDNPGKQGEFKAMQKELDALGQITDQLQASVEEARDNTEPPPEQKISEKAQIDLMKAQSQERVRNVKLQGSEQRSWAKLQFEQRLADARTAAEINRQKAKAAA